MLGWARLGLERHGKAWPSRHGRLGLAGSGKAWLGKAWPSRQGLARQGAVS